MFSSPALKMLRESTHAIRALSYHIFTAAILLLHESQQTEEADAYNLNDVIMKAVTLLDSVKIQSALAHRASTILKAKIEAMQLN